MTWLYTYNGTYMNQPKNWNGEVPDEWGETEG